MADGTVSDPKARDDASTARLAEAKTAAAELGAQQVRDLARCLAVVREHPDGPEASLARKDTTEFGAVVNLAEQLPDREFAALQAHLRERVGQETSEAALIAAKERATEVAGLVRPASKQGHHLARLVAVTERTFPRDNQGANTGAAQAELEKSDLPTPYRGAVEAMAALGDQESRKEYREHLAALLKELHQPARRAR